MMSTRKNLPSPWAIYSYWADRHTDLQQDAEGSVPVTELVINSRRNRAGDVTSAHIGCFACGRPETQRAHIRARCVGGEDTVENLHLLCRGCHAETELLDGEPYWKWLRNQRREPFVEHYARRRAFPDWATLCRNISCLLTTWQWDHHAFPSALAATSWEENRERLKAQGYDPLFMRDVMMAIEDMLSSGDCAWLPRNLGAMAMKNFRPSTAHRVRQVARPLPATRCVPAQNIARVYASGEARRRKANAFALQHGPTLLDFCTVDARTAAEMMTASEVLTPSGRLEWTPAMVKGVLKRYAALVEEGLA